MLIGRVRGLRRRVPRRQRVVGYGAGLLAGAGVSLLMVLFCVRLGARSDRRRHRHHAHVRGATALIFEAEFAESRPTLGADGQGRDPGSRPSCRSSAARGSRTAASSRSRSSSTSASASRSSWRGCCAARTPGLNIRAAGDAPGALDAAGVSVVRDALVGGAVRRRDGGARRRLPLDRRRRRLPGHHRRRAWLHRHRASRCSPAAGRCGS